MLSALVSFLLLSRAAGLTLCGVSNAAKPTLTDTCASAGGRASVAVHAARGEVEAGVALLDNAGGGDLAGVALDITWAAGAAPAGVTTAAFFVGYASSATGWFADALLPWPAAGTAIGANASASAWVNFIVASGAAPGAFAGTIAASGAAPLPFVLTVYNVVVPPLAASPFSTIYALDAGEVASFYGPTADANATLKAYYTALAALRFPATNIYATEPLPAWQYEFLGALGASTLILADISALPGAPPRVRGSAGRAAGRRAAEACPVFDAAYIARMVALLTPAWELLGKVGLQSRATVYGFDEIDAACEPSVRALFAAAKAAFPGVKTLSAIDWPTVPLDLPLDTWVLQYQLVNRNVTDAWVAAGHELFVYHCIEPSGAGYLNTFNENALIEARLLFWFDFLLDVTGHLYYDVALWHGWAGGANQPLPLSWASYSTTPGVSFSISAQREPLAAMAGAGDARMLGYDPANFIWAPRTDIWASGDGVFIYPVAPVGGTGVPVSTIRFEAQRDGVEDWHVFRAVADRNAAKAAAKTLVASPTQHSADTGALEAVRVAMLVAASG